MALHPFLRALAVALLVAGALGMAVRTSAPAAAEVVVSGEAQVGAEHEADDAVHAAPATLAVWVGGDVMNGLPESVRSGARAAPPTPPPEP